MLLRTAFCVILDSQPDHRRNKQDAPDLKVGRFFVPEGHSGSLLTECSCGAKNPGKARHILRPPAYVRSPAAQGLGKSRPARLNPNQITIQHPQPRHPKTVCYTQLHISQCLIETYTNYAIYRLKTFTACLLSRYSHTLLYDSILHGIIG